MLFSLGRYICCPLLMLLFFRTDLVFYFMYDICCYFTMELLIFSYMAPEVDFLIVFYSIVSF